MTLQEFLRDFRNQVHADAGTDGEEATLGDAFTRRFLESLAEAGETADADVAYFSRPRQGMRVDGYCADENEDTLDLFVSIHLDASDPERLEKARVEQALRQLASFYGKAQAGAPLLLGMAESRADESLSDSSYTLVRAIRHLRYVMERYGITKRTLGVTPHGLRHGFATRRYEDEVSADDPEPDDVGALRKSDERARLVVSRELGHSRKQITSVYLSSSRATIEARRRDRR